jgi:exopolyphosphatase/guanosine-5'-triphosphate,3'-diphosphate pyrophosphatase
VRLAAIDVGTNTVRLLVADASGSTLRFVDKGRAITRLGQGVDAGRRLAPEAIERTVEAIEGFVRRARDARADHIRITGTSAVRDASDRDAFVSTVNDRTGLAFEVLPGAEEGRISYLGATSELPHGDYVVCDIGGGSTELSTAESSISLDVGSVRLRERCLHSDPPTRAEITHAEAVVDEALELVRFDLPATLVGVAGTITTLTALILGQASYDADRVHRSVISRSDVSAWTRRLLDMPVDDVVALGPVERGRADVIAGGSLILARVMERWAFDEALISERDILDGLVLDLVQKLA